MEISGASQKRAKFASSYFVTTATAPAQGEAHEGHLKQIDLDVPRTFPEHTFFKSTQGQRALTMTLRAVAAHMPHIGYCQSMNYVAGLLLLVLDRDPEDAFWVLVALMEGMQRLSPVAPSCVSFSHQLPRTMLPSRFSLFLCMRNTIQGE
jgi:TBC1 domain family member 2A